MFIVTFAATPLPPRCPLDTLEIGEGVKCGIKNSWRYFLSLPPSSSTFCRPERGCQFPLTHSPCPLSPSLKSPTFAIELPAKDQVTPHITLLYAVYNINFFGPHTTLTFRMNIQSSQKMCVRSCEKCIPPLAYLFCLALPGSCSDPLALGSCFVFFFYYGRADLAGFAPPRLRSGSAQRQVGSARFDRVYPFSAHLTDTSLLPTLPPTLPTYCHQP